VGNDVLFRLAVNKGVREGGWKFRAQSRKLLLTRGLSEGQEAQGAGGRVGLGLERQRMGRKVAVGQVDLARLWVATGTWEEVSPTCGHWGSRPPHQA
jgi:hypothetical protein